jgi:hypothetical protein
MHLLSSQKSEMVCTVLSFLGLMNVGYAHHEDGCHSNTPMSHSHLISFMRTTFCLCGIGEGLPWYGFIPSLSSKDTGGSFQSLNVPSKSNSNLSSECSFSLLEAFRRDQFFLIMAGRSAFSYFASKISTTLLVVLQVLIGF